MKKYLVRYKNKYKVVCICDNTLLLDIELHKLEANKIASQLGKNVIRSNSWIYDYFGGTSKTLGYSSYSKSWVLVD